MKHLASSCLLLSMTCSLFAQAPQEKKPWPAMQNSPNYYEVRKAYLEYLEEERMVGELFGVETESDDYEAKFMRWDYLMRTRVDIHGNYPHPATLIKEFNDYKENHQSYYAGTREATWEPVGTPMVPINGGGVGRINVIAFDPDDSDIMYVGTAGGGVWRSMNAGDGWEPLTDNIPSMSIADIAIDPSNSDILYIATGDGYGYEITFQSDDDFWGGVYSAGVMKSTDGGLTWNPTGLSYNQDDLEIVQKIMIHPENPNTLIAATRNGLFRTTNGGDTWTMVDPTHCYDLSYDLDDPDRMYAVGDKDVLLSTNGGSSWSVYENNLCGTGRMTIENTEDNNNVLYCLCESGNFFKSENDGDTWSPKSSPTGMTLFWGYYDMAFDVSDLDENKIFGGGLEVVRSTNGGTSWALKSQTWNDALSDYVHADNHTFAFHPSIDNKIYAAGDGGIFVSTDNGESWDDVSDGLRISQAYRLSTSATSPDLVLTGWQDNGTNFWNGSIWEEIDESTWDGMEALIDHTNSDRMFLSHQYGGLRRTTNGGDTWTDLGVAGGDWVTPYVMDPEDNMIMYYGTSAGTIQKSINGGTSWTTKFADLGGSVFGIAIAPSNTNYVYACALERIKVSVNGGDSWSDITGTLPHSGIGFNYIAVSDEDPEHVWVVLSGYSDGDKVFYSENAGGSWTNISGTLPNVPVTSIVYENVSETDRVYISTDLGVFTKDNLAADWEPYMAGLPTVMVHELEINYTNYQLYAATYGRGIWRSDLYDFEAPSITVTVIESEYCPGETLNVSYVATGTYTGGNVFTAQLSDEGGGFASPVEIGELASVDLTGVISCTIPAGTDPGTEYRIRIVSSSPLVIGTDNGFDITITCAAPDGINTVSVTGTSAVLEWDAVECAVSYEVEYKPVSSPDWQFVTATDPTVSIFGLLPLTTYEWAVKSICVVSPESESEYSATDEFTTGQSAIEEISGLNGLTIYPNPFVTTTQVQFTLLSEMKLQITLLDITGREVLVVTDETLAPGFYAFDLAKNNLSQGVYTLEISNGEKSIGRKLIIE